MAWEGQESWKPCKVSWDFACDAQEPLCPQQSAGKGEAVLTSFPKTVLSPALSSMVTTVPMEGRRDSGPTTTMTPCPHRLIFS